MTGQVSDKIRKEKKKILCATNHLLITTDHSAVKDDASDNEGFVWPDLTSKCFMFTFTQHAVGAEVFQTRTSQKHINYNLQVYRDLRHVQKQAEPLVSRLLYCQFPVKAGLTHIELKHSPRGQEFYEDAFKVTKEGNMNLSILKTAKNCVLIRS